MGDLTFGGLIRNNGIEKDSIRMPSGPVWGEGMVLISVCGLQ